MASSANISELPATPALDLYTLLDLPLGSNAINQFLIHACDMEGLKGPLPEPVAVKYPDIIFHSYHSLGLSFGFAPTSPSPLIQVDLYNPPISPSQTTPSLKPSKPTFLPALQSILPTPLLRTSTAREMLLSELGEPSRKGGGEPNLGRLGLGVWMEWERDVAGDGEEAVEGKEGDRKKRGMKVEFDERGAGCWERDRLDKAAWRGCGLFLVD